MLAVFTFLATEDHEHTAMYFKTVIAAPVVALIFSGNQRCLQSPCLFILTVCTEVLLPQRHLQYLLDVTYLYLEV